MYITACPSLHPAIFLGRNRNGLATGTRNAQQFFRYGRDALYEGLNLLGIGAGDTVLVPASTCDVVLRTLVKCRTPIRYYDLTPALLPSVKEIEARLCAQTKALYVNHYFGIPGDFGPLRDLCRRRNIFLIEDCAHALSPPGSSVGTYGDIAIFSLRKLLPLPDGGALRSNVRRVHSERAAGAKTADLPAIAGVIKLAINGLAKDGYVPVASIKRARNSIESYLALSPAIEEQHWQPPADMSGIARLIAQRCDISAIGKARREHYAHWSRWSQAQVMASALVPVLPTHAAPFSFPLAVSDNLSVVRAMAKFGYYLEPTLLPPYREVPGLLNADECFPVVEYHASRLVSLPIHQALTLHHLQAMADTLDRVLSLRSG